jgi:hypothetical protein
LTIQHLQQEMVETPMVETPMVDTPMVEIHTVTTVMHILAALVLQLAVTITEMELAVILVALVALVALADKVAAAATLKYTA